MIHLQCVFVTWGNKFANFFMILLKNMAVIQSTAFREDAMCHQLNVRKVDKKRRETKYSN